MLREVTPSNFALGNLDSAGNKEVNVVASLSAGYAGTSSTPMQDGVLASLSLNFYDPLSTTLSSSTNTGLRDGLYTVVIRTGDFDTSSMMLIGAYDSYTVVKGDSPYKIAKKFKISPDELMKANGITDPKKIQIGQQLKIPVTKKSAK